MAVQNEGKSVILQGINLVKRFGDLVAVNNATISIRKGEIAALLGENGAGKSTLLKLLNGFLRPDQGSVIYNGTNISFNSPRDAVKKRIYTVYQNFSLVDKFTILENLELALPEKSKAELKDIALRFGGFVDLNARVAQLPIGAKQRLEITKALASNAEILLLDEPTSVLAYEERDMFFRELRRLRDEGQMAILITTHKLKDVLDYCERVTVMKNGKVVMEKMVKNVTMEELMKAMFGSATEFHDVSEIKEHDNQNKLLDVINVSVRGDDGRLAVKDVNFSLYRGEVLGIIGVAGNGQLELADAILGLRKLEKGQIKLNQSSPNPKRGLRVGRLGYISDDPVLVGLSVDLSLRDNFGIGVIDQISNGPIVNWRALDEFSESAIKKFSVKCNSLDQPLRELSGGNIQKVAIARELSRELDVLIAVHPAKGLDLYTTYLVYKEIREIARRGTSVLLISEDIDEVLELADYIGVIYEGRLSEVRPAQRWSRKDIGSFMTGAVMRS